MKRNGAAKASGEDRALGAGNGCADPGTPQAGRAHAKRSPLSQGAGHAGIFSAQFFLQITLHFMF